MIKETSSRYVNTNDSGQVIGLAVLHSGHLYCNGEITLTTEEVRDILDELVFSTPEPVFTESEGSQGYPLPTQEDIEHEASHREI